MWRDRAALPGMLVPLRWLTHETQRGGEQDDGDRFYECQPCQSIAAGREVGGEVNHQINNDDFDEDVLEFADAVDLHPIRNALTPRASDVEHEPKGDRKGKDDENDAEQEGIRGAHDGGRDFPGLSEAAEPESFDSMSELRPGKSKHQDRPEQRPKTGYQHQEAQREEVTHYS